MPNMLNSESVESVSGGMDEFNRLTVFILDALLNAFPKAMLLRADDFHESVDDSALMNMDGTMEFLRDEGFIKFASSAGDGAIFINVQLTLKALQLLENVPASLENGPTLGEKVKAAVKTGSKEAIKEVIKQIVASASGSF
jgi:hypothetical protein